MVSHCSHLLLRWSSCSAALSRFPPKSLLCLCGTPHTVLCGRQEQRVHFSFCWSCSVVFKCTQSQRDHINRLGEHSIYTTWFIRWSWIPVFGGDTTNGHTAERAGVTSCTPSSCVTCARWLWPVPRPKKGLIKAADLVIILAREQ